MIYAQIKSNNNKVLGVSRLKKEDQRSNLVEINKFDTRLLMCYYENGDFVGHYTVLEYDTGEVTATIYTWQDEIATDFSDDIIFEFDGETVERPAVDGVATLTFEVEEAGEYTVRTANEKIKNGEVTFNAEPSE